MGRYLVVIRERNNGCTDTQNHGRVDLAMRVGGAISHALLLKVIRGHGQHYSFLL